MALKINVNGVDRGGDVDHTPLLWVLRGGRR
jgi:hypothetical protein